MGFLVLLLLLAVVGSALLIQAWLKQERMERIHDRARLQVIEGQLAMLRAALRIQAAERMARRRLMALQTTDPFANPRHTRRPTRGAYE